MNLQAVAKRLEAEIPGAKVAVSSTDGWCLCLSYKCPCGNTSRVALRADEVLRPDIFVYKMKQTLRTHIMQEGFTPSF